MEVCAAEIGVLVICGKQFCRMWNIQGLVYLVFNSSLHQNLRDVRVSRPRRDRDVRVLRRDETRRDRDVRFKTETKTETFFRCQTYMKREKGNLIHSYTLGL